MVHPKQKDHIFIIHSDGSDFASGWASSIHSNSDVVRRGNGQSRLHRGPRIRHSLPLKLKQPPPKGPTRTFRSCVFSAAGTFHRTPVVGRSPCAAGLLTWLRPLWLRPPFCGCVHFADGCVRFSPTIGFNWTFLSTLPRRESPTPRKINRNTTQKAKSPS